MDTRTYNFTIVINTKMIFLFYCVNVYQDDGNGFKSFPDSLLFSTIQG